MSLQVGQRDGIVGSERGTVQHVARAVPRKDASDLFPVIPCRRIDETRRTRSQKFLLVACYVYHRYH